MSKRKKKRNRSRGYSSIQGGFIRTRPEQNFEVFQSIFGSKYYCIGDEKKKRGK